MAEFEFDLRDIFRVIRRRKWVILLSPILSAMLTYWISEVPPPVYSAVSIVKISRVAANMQALLVEALSWYQGDNIATQSQIVTSRKVRARVALRLSEGHPEFAVVGELLGPVETDDFDALEEQVRNNETLAALTSGVATVVERIGNSDTVSITASAASAPLAVDIANFTAEEFVNYNVAERNSQIRDAVRFIQTRIVQTEQELAAAERALEDFRTEYRTSLGLTLTDGSSLREEIDTLDRTLERLRQGIEELQRSSDLQAYLWYSPNLTEVDDAVVAQLETQLAQTINEINTGKMRLEELLSYSTELSREVQQSRQRIQQLEATGHEVMDSLVLRYDAVYEQLEARRGALAQTEEEMEGLPEASRRLAVLERQVALKTESLNLLERRLQDAEIQEASEIREVSIIEHATDASTLPESSRLIKTLAGLLVGLVLGGVFAVVLESLDTSIGTIEDVERYLKLPVLGVIPHLDLEFVKEHMMLDEMGDDMSSEDLNRMATLCTHFIPAEPVSEAFRSMRAQMDVLLKKNGWKTLMITSSVLQEGKTNTSCNLATIFGQSGQKTLLIDADLRRPAVHKVFGIPQGPGLADVLLGVTDWESSVRSLDDLILGKMGLRNSNMTPGLEYLYVLTAGRRVDRPAELLSLERTKALLDEMRQHYDVIIVDVAPVLPVAEATQLTPGIDATLVAYQIGRIGREVVNRTKTRLTGIGGNVVGLVMNDIEAEIYHTRDYEYYGYKYKYEEKVSPERSGGFFGGLRSKLSGWTRPAAAKPGISPPRRERPRKPVKRAEKPEPGSGADDEFGDIMKLTDED